MLLNQYSIVTKDDIIVYLIVSNNKTYKFNYQGSTYSDISIEEIVEYLKCPKNDTEAKSQLNVWINKSDFDLIRKLYGEVK